MEIFVMGVRKCHPPRSGPLAQAHVITMTNTRDGMGQGSATELMSMWGSCSQRAREDEKVESRLEPRSFFMLVEKNKATLWNTVHVKPEICPCRMSG